MLFGKRGRSNHACSLFYSLPCLDRLNRFVIFLLWIATVVYRFYYNLFWLSVVIKCKAKILPHNQDASSFLPCLNEKTFVNSVIDSLYHTSIIAAWLLHITHIRIIIQVFFKSDILCSPNGHKWISTLMHNSNKTVYWIKCLNMIWLMPV